MKNAEGERRHLAFLHQHIHATEMSNERERAMRYADILGTLCPVTGRMNHMRGHTFVLCGEYEKVKIASEKATHADDMYVDYVGAFNFYTTAPCHDLHLMMYACMCLGQNGKLQRPPVVAIERNNLK